MKIETMKICIRRWHVHWELNYRKIGSFWCFLSDYVSVKLATNKKNPQLLLNHINFLFFFSSHKKICINVQSSKCIIQETQTYPLLSICPFMPCNKLAWLHNNVYTILSIFYVTSVWQTIEISRCHSNMPFATIMQLFFSNSFIFILFIHVALPWFMPFDFELLWNRWKEIEY